MGLGFNERLIYRYNMQMNAGYVKNGYLVIRRLFEERELVELHDVLLSFHQAWLKDNVDFYQQRAINSAYITGKQYLDDQRRQILFEFIGSDKIADVLAEVIQSSPVFINTQLFFDPVNDAQKNYWHRDIQYSDLTIEQQKQALHTINALHFRIPLTDERGIELVPGTHMRWDNTEEFNVRMEQNGKRCFDELSDGRNVELQRGDLLVFSANMIHRGLCGGNRLVFDILFGDNDPEITKLLRTDCLPNSGQLKSVQNPLSFINSIESKNG